MNQRKTGSGYATRNWGFILINHCFREKSFLNFPVLFLFYSLNEQWGSLCISQFVSSQPPGRNPEGKQMRLILWATPHCHHTRTIMLGSPRNKWRTFWKFCTTTTSRLSLQLKFPRRKKKKRAYQVKWSLNFHVYQSVFWNISVFEEGL